MLKEKTKNTVRSETVKTSRNEKKLSNKKRLK